MRGKTVSERKIDQDRIHESNKSMGFGRGGCQEECDRVMWQPNLLPSTTLCCTAVL